MNCPEYPAWHEIFEPCLISRDMESSAKLMLLTEDCRACAWRFKDTMRTSEPTATTATTMKMAIETIISTSVKPR
jgi:hypothetical protein